MDEDPEQTPSPSPALSHASSHASPPGLRVRPSGSVPPSPVPHPSPLAGALASDAIAEFASPTLAEGSQVGVAPSNSWYSELGAFAPTPPPPSVSVAPAQTASTHSPQARTARFTTMEDSFFAEGDEASIEVETLARIEPTIEPSIESGKRWWHRFKKPRSF